TLDSIGGRISVDNQNGAIAVTAMRGASGCRDISLKTSFSSIRVRVPEGVGYNLSARTSFGRGSSELPVPATGTMGGDSLNGTIGSRGRKRVITDSNGSIEIAKATSAPGSSTTALARPIEGERLFQDARRRLRQMKFGEFFFFCEKHIGNVASGAGLAAD